MFIAYNPNAVWPSIKHLVINIVIEKGKKKD